MKNIGQGGRKVREDCNTVCTAEHNTEQRDHLDNAIDPNARILGGRRQTLVRRALRYKSERSRSKTVQNPMILGSGDLRATYLRFCIEPFSYNSA